MQITIGGTPKEVAALAAELKGRQPGADRTEDIAPHYDPATRDDTWRTGNITLGYQDDMETLENIIKVDPNAIIVNSYVHNLGVMDGYVTLADLSNALRWQYDLQRATLTDLLECVVQPK